ncbi:MAG: FumA C-terminus/TtdB family hydratase beta subunit [Ignisphaera sp.]
MTVYKLRAPLKEEDIKELRAGDTVYVSGIVYTARDAAHRRFVEYLREGKELPFNLSNSAIYHCGPVAVKEGDKWRIVSAGPTTSMRMEPYEHIAIERLGVKMIIGKGGMGKKTAEACKKHGAVYTVFTGGAGVLAAQAIKRVVEVYWLDLGMPEAIWKLDVEDFGPLTVAIDSTGRNIIDEVIKIAIERKKRMLSQENEDK